MARVFICYDREDRDFAEVVQAKLERAGHATVMDFDILSAGDDWQDRLDDEIRRSQALVVIMTPEARSSDYVAYEWAFALGAGVTVIPLELRPTPFSPRLDSLHRLDFTNKARPWDTLTAEVGKAEAANPVSSVSVDPGAPALVKQAARGIDSLDPEERVAAIRTLTALDHPAALAVLTQTLEHPVSDVRSAAACLFPDLSDPRAVPGLLQALRDRSTEGFDRTGFRHRMVAIGPAAVPALLQALPQEPDHVRSAVIEALGRVGDPGAVPALCEVLRDAESGQRPEAARALGQLADQAAAPALEGALTDHDAHVRAAAATSLGSLRHAPALPRLVELLEGDGPSVRAAAAAALGEIGDPSVLTHLTEALEDGDAGVRINAVLALGAVHAQAAVPRLRELLGRRAALEDIGEWDNALMTTLLRLGDAESLPLVEQKLINFRSGSYGRVGEICGLMAEFGEAGVERVVTVLRTADSKSVQREAARLLAALESPGAATALRAWRRTND